jgi:hypothetical protein
MIVGNPPLEEVVDELENLHFLEAYRTQEDIDLIQNEGLKDIVPTILGPYETPELWELAVRAGRAEQWPHRCFC